MHGVDADAITHRKTCTSFRLRHLIVLTKNTIESYLKKLESQAISRRMNKIKKCNHIIQKIMFNTQSNHAIQTG